MKTELIGERTIFAIEYCLLDCPRPFGHVRLWFSNVWVGDLEQSCFLDYLCRKLYFLMSSRISKTDLTFPVLPSPSELEELINLGNWSFNEAFFDFDLFYYGVIHDRQLHFHWQMSDALRGAYPEYPKAAQTAVVPFHVFDQVAASFLTRIFSSTVGWDELAASL